ncbi:hypothetical protein ACFYYH_05040 [Streptomyces sp. NPDC002018]|uniref:hypothetical protein n=1 Tax=Streptomyces sp. NPDC002018 TaxID=3364629 RepID=UPI00367A973D
MRVVTMGGAEFWIQEGKTLGQRPRLAPGDLLVDRPRGPEEHELHLVETFGCGDWRIWGTEEFRFSPESLALVSVWLGVPDDTYDDHQTPEAWAGRTVVRGLPTAREPRSFQLPPEVSRQFSVEHDLLACFVADVSGYGEKLGVEIAEGLELLFADGRYAGWLLRAPETALGRGPAAPDGTERDPELMGWLAEFYAVTRDDIVAGIELEDDLEALGAMRRLMESIRLDGDVRGRRAALRNHLAAWVENLEEQIA